MVRSSRTQATSSLKLSGFGAAVTCGLDWSFPQVQTSPTKPPQPPAVAATEGWRRESKKRFKLNGKTIIVARVRGYTATLSL